MLKQPKNDLRGLLIPEPAILDATYTATSQAGPRGGPVTPDQSTGLALTGYGELDASSSVASGTSLELGTYQGGSVGTATLRWRYPGEDWRNYDPPTAIAGWEFIDRSAVSGRYRYPHVVRRKSTGLLVAVATYDSTTLKCWRQDARGNWSSTDIVTTDNATKGTLVELASGRLACVYTYSGSSTTQLRTQYSDDGGATWSIATSSGLETPIAYAASDIVKIRGAYLNGQVCLLVAIGSTYDVQQYCSLDDANRWFLVENLDYAGGVLDPDLTVYSGQLWLSYVYYTTGTYTSGIWSGGLAVARKVASAAQSFSSCEAIAINPDDATVGFSAVTPGATTALCTADDGKLYFYGRDYGDVTVSATRNGEIVCYVSTDGGQTWAPNFVNSRTNASAPILWSGELAIGAADITVAPERGRLVMLHAITADVPNDYTSLCAAYLGGWSTVGMPDPTGYASWETGGWDVTYVPIDKPADYGTTWTKTTSGVGTTTESLGQQGLTILTDTTARLYYDATPTLTGYETDGVLCEWHVRQVSGTSYYQVQISDGVRAFAAELRVTTTSVELRDLIAAASIATLTIDTTKGVAIRLAVDNTSASWALNTGRARAWARVDGPYTGAVLTYGPRADRNWTQVGTSSTLNSVAAVVSRIRWGNVSTVGEAVYRFVGFSAGREVADNIADSATGDGRGCVIGGPGSPLHLVSGYRIHGTDGPTARGDTYSTTASYEYPISAVNPSVSPSPRRKWRSTNEAQTDITISGLDLGARSGDVWGLYIAGANWRNATLYRDASAANKLVDIDLAKGLTGLNFTRVRDLVYPRIGGSGSGIYVQEQSLVGATVLLSAGQPRKVKANTTGAWLSAAANSYVGTRVQLESYQVGDTASGAAEVWMPNGLVLFDNMQGVTDLLLRIQAQTTADGYFSLGTLLVGRVRWFGQQYSRGRSISFTPAYELTETRSGARRARSLGPTRKALEIAWDDGVDTTGINSLPTAPDYWTLGYAGADPIATKPDTALSLGGVIQTTQGAVLPTVLISAVKQQAGSPGTAGVHLLNPEAFLYGRILTETLRIDSDPNAMGDELSDPGEVSKVGSVRFEAEV